MKFPKVTALVPEGEHFDESAILNEGVWLTGKHLNNIEAAFVAHDSLVELAANVSNKEINGLQEQLSAAQTSLTTSSDSLETANARIVELEAEIVALNKKPAAEFKEPVTSEDRGKDLPNGKSKYHTSIDDEALAYRNK